MRPALGLEEDGATSREVPEFGSKMSSKSSHRAVRSGALLALAGVLTGCGATGLDWVAEPETPARQSETVNMSRAVVLPAGPASVAALEEQEPAPDARPRLSHTVTLGEIEAVPPSASAGASAPGVSVTINNYTSVNAASPGYGYGYANVGFARSQPSFSLSGGVGSASRLSGSGPQAGQNWPSIADHGSSFPLRSAPASAWSRTQ
jgi:hypothetical protein